MLLLLGIVLFLHKKVSEIQSIPAWLSFLAALAFFPISYALMQGQDSIMLLALYCLAYVALRRGRDLQAGIWLGLGLFKFHLVLPFVLILFLRRRWRAVLGVGISGAFDFAAFLGTRGWQATAGLSALRLAGQPPTGYADNCAQKHGEFARAHNGMELGGDGGSVV